MNDIKALGRKSFGVKADVTKPDEVKAMVARAVEVLGKIDILVKNAGIYSMSSAEETSAADWDAVMSVNLRGQFLSAREAGRHMIRQRSGK